MELEPHKPASEAAEFAEPRQPLVLLRNTERSLREKTVSTIVPLLPEDLATTVNEASQKANESLDQLAKIDLNSMTDAELKSARTLIGLTFVGFGSLAMLFLALCLSTLHPELNAIAQIHDYWHQYVWLLAMGVAGLVMLGREALRPPED
jgi:hypothetical protein